MQINWIDFSILLILAVTALRGLIRGLIRSVFDILAFAVSILFGFHWYRDLSLYLTNYIKLPGNVIYAVSFILIFIATYIITALIGSLLHNLVGKGILGPLNALGGGIIGLIKGVLIIWIVLQILIVFPLPQNISSPLKKSQGVKVLKPALEYTSQLIFKMTPKDMNNIKGYFKL